MATLTYSKHKILWPEVYLEYSNIIIHDKLTLHEQHQRAGNGLVRGNRGQRLFKTKCWPSYGTVANTNGARDREYSSTGSTHSHAWYFHFERHRSLRKYRDSVEMACGVLGPVRRLTSLSWLS
jgi:hypothetical protein